MMSRRGPAVAIALLLAALAAAGCGLGPGDELGEVELTVTWDYGAEPVRAPVSDKVSESDTVMRVLERNAKITTSYGGGFVQSIDGIEAEESFGGSSDWFYYVDGVEATVGAADYTLHGGEKVWWDYRNWDATMRVPAVVGSWPQPFSGGYGGEQRPVAVECMGGGQSCEVVAQKLEQAGASVAAGAPQGAIRVLVGPWARVRQDPAAAQIEEGPEASGVFADFVPRRGGFSLEAMDQSGKAVRRLGAKAGLVAATRRYEAPPVWVVTGAGPTGVRAAAGLLDAAHLRDRYAVAVEGEDETSLPLP